MSRKTILTSLLVPVILSGNLLLAEFHAPFQPSAPLDDCRGASGPPGGYFRPEYAELVQRLDRETMEWLVRSWPVLGWQGMDSRIHTPRPIPGSDQPDGFRYDASRRYIEMEAVFHFGPRGGNGTLIEEVIELDERRLLTVNRGSRNISVIDTGKPDIAAVIPTSQWLKALDFSLHHRELYLVERNARGMLVWSLDDYTVTDTLILGFHPGAVLLSRNSHWLYLTDEHAGELVRLDLSNPEQGPERMNPGVKPPFFIAEDRNSGALVVAGIEQGALSLIDPERFRRIDQRLDLRGRLLAHSAPRRGDGIFLAAGGCDRSSLYHLSVGDGSALLLRKLADVGGAVSSLGADDKGDILCAVAGHEVYRIRTASPADIARYGFNDQPRRVLPVGSRIFVTAGLDALYALDRDMKEKARRVGVEMGPGPLVERDGSVWVANCLANSFTVVDAGRLREEVSLLVGVLLGGMVYQDRRITVNNVFRGNVMVLNPETWFIEDIVPVGGSMHYSASSRRLTMFDDSLVVGMDYPPSKVSISTTLDMPQGVKLFSATGDPQSFLVADQKRYVTRIDLNRRFRFGGVPMPAEVRALFVLSEDAWALSASDVFRFEIAGSVGIRSSYQLRAFKFAPPFVAADYRENFSGSLIHVISRDRVLDLTSIPGAVNVVRQDPDTSYYYFGTDRGVRVFDRRDGRALSVIAPASPADDIYLPSGSPHGYMTGGGRLNVFDRQTLFERDRVEVDGRFVYVSGDYLFLADNLDPRLFYVVDGYRGSLYQQTSLPVIPTDAVADQDRIFLLGGTDGAIAVYVNYIAAERLPRTPDRHVWDSGADRRTGVQR